jgi:hypothetical protein
MRTVQFRVGLANSMSRPSIVGTPAMGFLFAPLLQSLLAVVLLATTPFVVVVLHCSCRSFLGAPSLSFVVSRLDRYVQSFQEHLIAPSAPEQLTPMVHVCCIRTCFILCCRSFVPLSSGGTTVPHTPWYPCSWWSIQLLPCTGVSGSHLDALLLYRLWLVVTTLVDLATTLVVVFLLVVPLLLSFARCLWHRCLFFGTAPELLARSRCLTLVES